jgi:hypothetical protein
MAMRHRGGGIGHRDPAQCAKFCRLSDGIGPDNATEEVHQDSDDCSSFAEEGHSEKEDDRSSDDVGESGGLEEVGLDDEYDDEYDASSQSDFSGSDD